jgi:hypothetical protein
VCNALAHLVNCLGIVALSGVEGNYPPISHRSSNYMAAFAGLLWAIVYAMGMRRLIGALSLLLYLGSLGTQVVHTLPFSSLGLPVIYPHPQYGITVSHSQKLMQLHISGYGSSKFVSDDSTSYFETCPYIISSGVRKSQVQFQFNRPFIPSGYNK